MSIDQVNVQVRRGLTPSDLGFARPVEEGLWEDSELGDFDEVDWDSLEHDVSDWASLDRDPPPPFGDLPPPHGDPPPPQVPHFFAKVGGQVAADPLDRAVAELRNADRAMAAVLRAVADAGPRDGLSVRRHVALAANATGIDVGFIDRAVQTLSAMPKVWAAFDVGGLSWSQLRGIIIQARRLTVAQRQVLDDALSGLLASGGGEPDRIVETAGDLAARLDREGEADNEDAQERSQGVVLQPDFEGWTAIHGTLAPEVGATLGEALDAAADLPVSPDDPRPTDANGTIIPKSVRPVPRRSAQWAEALGRIAATYLGGEVPYESDGDTRHDTEQDGAEEDGAANDTDGGDTGRGDTEQEHTDVGDTAEDGTAQDGGVSNADGRKDQDSNTSPAPQTGPAPQTRPAPQTGRTSTASRTATAGRRRARPRVLLLASLSDLLDLELNGDSGVGSVVSRLLLRRGSGRQRITRALVRSLTDDAEIVPIFTDDGGMPVAIGDAYSPISPALRRAVMARDQGCRAPGCTAPAAHCDIHHVIAREDDGPTDIANLVLICRADHTHVTRRRWRMTMDPDGTLHTTIRRNTYTTRPRLTPPPTLRPAGADPPSADPPGADPPSADPPGSDPRGADPTGSGPPGVALPGSDPPGDLTRPRALRRPARDGPSIDRDRLPF